MQENRGLRVMKSKTWCGHWSRKLQKKKSDNAFARSIPHSSSICRPIEQVNGHGFSNHVDGSGQHDWLGADGRGEESAGYAAVSGRRGCKADSGGVQVDERRGGCAGRGGDWAGRADRYLRLSFDRRKKVR